MARFRIRWTPEGRTVAPVAPPRDLYAGIRGEGNFRNYDICRYRHTPIRWNVIDRLHDLFLRIEGHATISRRCRYAPVAIRLDGRLVNDPDPAKVGNCLARRFVLGQGNSANLLAMRPPEPHDSRRFLAGRIPIAGVAWAGHGLTELATVAPGDPFYPGSRWRMELAGKSRAFGATLPLGADSLYLDPSPYARSGPSDLPLLCHSAFLLPASGIGGGGWCSSVTA
ncbi:MAG: hypothetical protein HY319_30860 [Armatimonadetes bacterium]|nr:hypothetical protein [Armatimonadota bacterium]